MSGFADVKDSKSKVFEEEKKTDNACVNSFYKRINYFYIDSRQGVKGSEKRRER